MLGQRSSQTRLSYVAVSNGKTHCLAVVLQNEVLAYLQPVPPIWPQGGARFCAGDRSCVKGLRFTGVAGDSPGSMFKTP